MGLPNMRQSPSAPPICGHASWPVGHLARRSAIPRAISTAEIPLPGIQATPFVQRALHQPQHQQQHQGHHLGLSTPGSVPTLVPNANTRLKIAVDVDEVLGRFLHSLNRFCLEQYGMDFDVGDYSEYNFAKVWSCSQDESNHIVHEFFKSRHFAVGVLPIPGALHSLRQLSAVCDLVVVTSRQHVIREPTLAWVEQHFPSVFREVHFGNHWAMEGQSKAKSDICREIGAHVLIDDNPRYALECAQAGIYVLLYDWQQSYPWSKTPDGTLRLSSGLAVKHGAILCRPGHRLIKRVTNWTDVEAALAPFTLPHQTVDL